MQAATLENVYSTDVSSGSSGTTTVQAEAQALLAEGVLDQNEALSWLYDVDWSHYIACMEREHKYGGV